MSILESIFDASNIWGLIIGTLLGAEISRFLYRPNVIIRFERLQPLFSDNGFFASVIVANRGRTASINTQGKVTLFFDDKNLMEPSLFNFDAFETSLPTYRLENLKMDFPRHQLITPEKKVKEIKNVSLCWATLGNPEKVEINPGASEALNIFRAQLYIDNDNNQKFWYLIFPCEQGWRKVRCRIMLKTNDSIKGKLFICPSNTFPTVKKIHIYIKEDYPILSIQEFNFFENIYYIFKRSKLYFD
ncbi:hypothetical protein M2451_002962 [Dysgonomonas sp. PFB1-18]|uniref:hypothetical protein n=1 Tax=unclassified Dysgonomonas TaxID=2630389 RepID=UPI0013D1A259|nr:MULTISPECIES: hypothetical protein [unclassified Dysgonomonas]MDH6310072.1 hypothetical protein [Dysgonomonas sp. PF1-14]MDH6339980.1 hypothetical protein [Dysgonomonas sp. PF1-16]MDH6381629.1 hypothetical protein [Dysgonomonas sp. PFB1-18]MDH6398734.1 hypothetical protein [Dysgonomonas sp. PF1-23]NDV93580.1 hypothetical protein [Dysgonomonas sp. 521]